MDNIQPISKNKNPTFGIVYTLKSDWSKKKVILYKGNIQ